MFLKVLQNSQKTMFAWVFFLVKLQAGNLRLSESSHRRCSVKKGVLKNFANFTGKHLCWRLFFMKLQFWRPVTLSKKTPTHVFSRDINEIFKNSYFDELLWITVYELYLKRDFNTGAFLRILRINKKKLYCNGWFWNTSAGVSLWWSCKLTTCKRKRL